MEQMWALASPELSLWTSKAPVGKRQCWGVDSVALGPGLFNTHLCERKRKSFTSLLKVTKASSGLCQASFHQFHFSCALVRNSAHSSTCVSIFSSFQIPDRSLSSSSVHVLSPWNRFTTGTLSTGIASTSQNLGMDSQGHTVE